MKNFLSAALLLVFLSFTPFLHTPAGAQSASGRTTQTLIEVLDALEKADLFVQYRKFRTDFQRMNSTLAPQLQNPASYEELRLAYTQVERQYNGLLEEIKRDLSDYKRIEEMIKRPGVFADRYSDRYAFVLREYETNYLKVYNRLNVSKSIPPALIVAGIDLVIQVIGIMRNRGELKGEALNVVLGTINTYFYDKIRMKTWEEMGFQAPLHVQPEGGGQVKPAPTPSLPVRVQEPIFGELSGWVEFVEFSTQGRELPISFDRPLTKSITVETRRLEDGVGRTDRQSARVATFESRDHYGEGTQFLLRVKNTAGMYVLALNSGNEVLFLYPYKNDALMSCNDYAPLDKAIRIDYLNPTPVVGKDQRGVTTLPVPDCRQTPPADRYFTISGDGHREELAIILTRSELDVEAVRSSLQAVPGSLDERLARVFASDLISPGKAVSLHGNLLEFHAGNPDRSVLPVVFHINRK